MKWKYFLLLGVLCITWLFTNVNAAEPTSHNHQIVKGFEKESGLEYQMEILRDIDNGVYGLLISIKNLSDKNDVLLNMPADKLEAIIVLIRSSNGEIISKLPKIYEVDGEVRQMFSSIVVPKLGAQEWFVPMKDLIESRESLKNGVKGSIVVRLVMNYKLVSPRKSKSKNDFIKTNYNLIDNNLFFTPQALERESQ